MERTSAILLLAFGAVMCAISLALPPTGEIDGSVLMLFGQILVYASSVFGVRIYIKDLMNQHKTHPNRWVLYFKRLDFATENALFGAFLGYFYRILQKYKILYR